MSLKIKYWGVRGSLPSAPLPEHTFQNFEKLMHQFFKSGNKDASQIKFFMEQQSLPRIGGFGTATTCVEIKSPKTQIIIDGGSGIRNLSEEMVKGPCGKGRGEVHIFLTHFHWDHLIGLPFFAPHFIKGNKIHYYAVQPNLDEMIKVIFRKPWFPVPFEALGADIQFHQMEPRKPLQIGDMKITPYQLDHPDPCWGFRVESGGKSYAHCVDTEATRTTRETMGADVGLYQNVDLMYFDAQYTLPELAEKANWGHSAAQIGLEIAQRENVKSILFAHHDPGANAEQIFEIQKGIREFCDDQIKKAALNHREIPEVKWQYAFEGMVVNLGED
jgi:phosphoribosyl 1,2-cyclic phosphodiesterase